MYGIYYTYFQWENEQMLNLGHSIIGRLSMQRKSTGNRGVWEARNKQAGGNSRLTGKGQIDRRETMVGTADQKKKEIKKRH
jgi:hypothetical protein